MGDIITCASCATPMKSRKQCSRCGTSYCSTTCQRAHWKVHKPSCYFKVVLPTSTTPSTDALSLLRTMPDPGIHNRRPGVSSVAQRAFNIPELRMAVFSELPAIDLLRTQRVCRSWYLTSALETNLQQRLFLSHGPGELLKPSHKCKYVVENCRRSANVPCQETANLTQLSILSTRVNAVLSKWNNAWVEADHSF